MNNYKKEVNYLIVTFLIILIVAFLIIFLPRLNSQNIVKLSHDIIGLDTVHKDKEMILDSDIIVMEDTIKNENSISTIKEFDKKVYKSKSNKHFLETARKINGNSEIGFYNEKGNLLWKKERMMVPSRCYISDNGNYIHVLWSDVWNYQDYQLITYDDKGNELEKRENVRFIDMNKSKNVLYYSIYKENKFFVGLIDYIKNNYWEKVFNDESGAVLSVSEKGDFLIIKINQEMLMLDEESKNVWTKNFKGGMIDISSDGEYIAYLNFPSKCYIFNKNGQLEFEFNELLINGNTFFPDMTEFIKDTHILSLANYGHGITKIAFIDIKGNLLDTIIIPEVYKSYYTIEKYKDNYRIYFDEKLVFDGLIKKLN